MISAVLAGYAAGAADLVRRFESVLSVELYEPVRPLLPTSPASIIDIGAGTGRDAAWLAAQGHRVVAVEPVAELREAGRGLHALSNIEWVDDCLPELSQFGGRAESFDYIILSGVCQHLDVDAREESMPRLAALLRKNGVLIMSIRHGPGVPSRPVFATSAKEALDLAASAGLWLAHSARAESIQAANHVAGVSWTWLCLKKR